jgi:elongation factor Ts
MIEVNSETDFVAKNESFRAFVKDLLSTIIANKPADMDAFMEMTCAGAAVSVKDTLVEKIAQIGEKISIRRFVIVEGLVSTYIHGMGATGVVVKFNAPEAVAATADFAEFSKNIALQIAAGNPPKYVNREEVPASEVDEEKAILIQQAKNDPKNANKPDAILEKMVGGRLGKFYERVCLVDQPYVKEDKMTVGEYVKATAKALGGEISIVSFEIFEKGEGIEKREENFAEEIAKLAGGAN